MAEPEKALIDFIYLSKRRDIRSFLSGLRWERLRLQKLRSYARRMQVDLSAAQPGRRAWRSWSRESREKGLVR